jgi:hypothetical protein
MTIGGLINTLAEVLMKDNLFDAIYNRNLSFDYCASVLYGILNNGQSGVFRAYDLMADFMEILKGNEEMFQEYIKQIRQNGKRWKRSQ